jgi:hypothetical protein
LKILIAINSDIYVRNYLRTKAFSRLFEKFDCEIIVNNSISLRGEVEQHPAFRGLYSGNARSDRWHQILFNVLMWRNRKKSQTFLYRWMRNSQWPLLSPGDSLLRRAALLLRWAVGAGRGPNGLLIPFLGSRLLSGITTRWLKRKIPINPTISSFFTNVEYDLVIFPSAGYDSATIDLTRQGRRSGTKTLCLIDNWDNLSSKTVFWIRPDFLGVWGEQSASHAEIIQGFETEQVFTVGTPRFDVYFSPTAQQASASHYPFPYVLFVGSAMPFDEEGALHEVETALDQLPSKFQKFRVVYRPHPWRQGKSGQPPFDSARYTRTLLDKQMASRELSHSGKGVSEGFQPDLDYYPSLISHAELVVGPLTTMLLEGTLCKREVLGLAYPDGKNAHTSRRYFAHFDGMDACEGFDFCIQQNDLVPLVQEKITRDDPFTQRSVAAYPRFIHKPLNGYANELLSIITTIVEER